MEPAETNPAETNKPAEKSPAIKAQNDKRAQEKKVKDISGTKWAAVIRQELKDEIDKIIANGGLVPTIACILVGDRNDSAVYVRNKESACKELGIRAIVRKLPATATQVEIIALVQEFNADPTVNGILVQLPLPQGVEEKAVLATVKPEKDVDGGPQHMGDLALKGHTPQFISCTPKAVLELLKREKIPIEGANVVVLGRSNLVGLPVSLLLIHENATVTICHSKTKDVGTILKTADIIIAAIGQPKYVKPEWIKPGAVIIDVGINSIPDSTRKTGLRLVGDVDYDGAFEVCSRITPVPGGVGPMTIAMLLQNTLVAYKRQNKTPDEIKKPEVITLG